MITQLPSASLRKRSPRRPFPLWIPIAATLILGWLGQPALADAPRVVASIKPLHALAAAVMEGLGEPELLVDGAATPHGFTLKPSDARALAEADLVIRIGPQLEGFLVRPLAELAADAVVITLTETEGVDLLPRRDGGTWSGADGAHDHGHGHGHGHGNGHGHGHGHGHANDPNADIDPHLWLDPHNADVAAQAVAEALARIDPANAAAYAANAARMSRAIAAAEAAMKVELASVRDVPFLVFHDGFQYLDRHFGLRAVGAVTLNPETPPGAGRVREIQNRIRTTGAACVFAEPQFNPRIIDVIVAGTDARIAVLDPLGASLTNGPALYGEMMLANARAIRICLAGLG